jgi:hypothetical protein
MKSILVVSILLSICVCECARGDTAVVFSGEKKRNNLVSDLLEVTSISKAGNAFAFTRSREGWIFVSAAYRGEGRLSILFENSSGGEPVVLYAAKSSTERGQRGEAMRRVANEWTATATQAMSNRKLSRVEATEFEQGDPLTRNRRKDGFAPPWAADCVPLRIQHWVFETAARFSTRIEGRSGLCPTSGAAACDRDPNSTRWQLHHIHPKLDKHGSIERSIDARPTAGFRSLRSKRPPFPEYVWLGGARFESQKLGGLITFREKD